MKKIINKPFVNFKSYGMYINVYVFATNFMLKKQIQV